VLGLVSLVVSGNLDVALSLGFAAVAYVVACRASAEGFFNNEVEEDGGEKPDVGFLLSSMKFGPSCIWFSQVGY
jgi:hypothetical protein